MQFVIVTRSAPEMARASAIMSMLVRDPDLMIGPQLPLVSRPTKSERAPVDFGPVQLAWRLVGWRFAPTPAVSSVVVWVTCWAVGPTRAASLEA